MTSFRAIALLAGCCCIGVLAVAQKDQSIAPAGNVFQYVDPMIGSEGLGRVFIGPSCPFGMIKPSPDCTSRPNSGWLPAPVPVTGFGQVHVSGTGGGPKYGNILIMPFSGEPDKIDQSSLRENERVSLGYYGVTLKKGGSQGGGPAGSGSGEGSGGSGSGDGSGGKGSGDGILAEITTAERVAFYRFSYPQAQKKSLKIDAGFFLGEQPEPDAREAQQFVGSEIEVVSGTEVRGYSRIRGGWNNGGAYTVYFDAVFDHPIGQFASWKGSRLDPGKKLQFDSGEKTGVLLSFAEGEGGTAGAGRDTVNVKIGISFISSSKARENIDREIPHWSFGQVLDQVRDKWEGLLHRVEIDPGATMDQKKLFYTALYHTMLMPVNRTGENPLWTGDQPYYDDFYAIWDTFRSSNPLITILSPSRETEIVNSLINIYKHDGYMPDSRSGNSNGRTQGGSNAEVLIADAFVKGLKGIDYEQAMDAMLKDANVPPGGNEEKEGRGGLTDYNRLGYVSYQFVRSGNRTLDYAYDDYCIAMVAKGLNKQELYERFIRQSDNWQHLWRDHYEDHGASGFIMPKDASGRWLDSISYGESRHEKPTFVYTPLSREYPWYICHWCGFFYEATSWEYSLSIPHQVPAIIARSGGAEAFRRRLDTLFDNHYYNVANEPSFLTPCLYHWIGRPDLSSQRIRQIIFRNYNTSHSGLPGNDDAGAMSSWLAFHMMGLYPNAGQSYYLLNPPLVSRIVIHQENGRDFTIISRNVAPGNSYVKAVTLNGRRLDGAWIEHADLVRGGELVYEMDAKPSAWGTVVLPPASGQSAGFAQSGGAPEQVGASKSGRSSQSESAAQSGGSGQSQRSLRSAPAGVSAETFAPVIQAGTRLSYTLYLHGQQIPFELSVKTLTDTLDLHWSIRGLAAGDYKILPAAWDHATKMNFVQPAPGAAIDLASDETFCMISKTAFGQLLKDHRFIYGNTVYQFRDDAKERPVMLDGRPLDLLHVAAQDETTEFWILNNPRFPLVCKIKGSVLGIDCTLNGISQPK